MKPQARYLPGNRLHLNHGPIDLVIGAEGEPEAAFQAATRRFDGLLEELVAELPALRQPDAPLSGPIARRMGTATAPHPEFITPMAAVAGAVADEVLATMTFEANLTRAYVNNGGDIALHLTGAATFTVAMATDTASDLGRVTITADDPVRGIATSGRGGRSLSMGIADSVTVLADTAAGADAAATLIANAVDLPRHPAIRRMPAATLDPDSDLGAREVVTDCAPLSANDRQTALVAGLARAETMRRAGLIHGAALFFQGAAMATGIQTKELTHA